MTQPHDEEQLLRAVALQNAQSIHLARQRAEEELERTREALERKTEELARSLAMMRATLEATSDGILVTDRSAAVTHYNARFVEMWRFPGDLLETRVHRRLLDFSSTLFADPQQFLARIDEIYATLPPETYDLLELADGRVIERSSRIQFVEERNVGRVWSFRDITEARLAQEELRKQSEWWRVTLSSVGDAVITTDPDGRVTSMNAVAESLTGWTQQEAQGVSLDAVFRVVNEDTRRVVENPALRALREGQIVGLANHTVLIDKNGSEAAIDDSAAPITDDDGNVVGVVLIFRDITAKRLDERKLRESEAALKEADQRKNEFLAMLAHELRNPLAPIINAVQILRATSMPLQEQRFAIDVIDRQVQHTTRLVEDLMDVSRITRGKVALRKHPIELTAVLNRAVEASRPLIEQRGHDLTISVPSEPIHLDGDLTRLAQVFLNLLNNAAKYTDRGGRIVVTAQLVEDDVTVRVRDTGVGIHPDMLPHVFELFTQADRSLERSQGGLGIGLTLVERLVTMHGGSVEAHSAGLGQGSEFVVRLPIAHSSIA